MFFAVEVGCVAWFVSNVDKSYKTFVILDIVAIVITAGVLSVMVSKVRKYLKLLRE